MYLLILPAYACCGTCLCLPELFDREETHVSASFKDCSCYFLFRMRGVRSDFVVDYDRGLQGNLGRGPRRVRGRCAHAK